MGDDTNTIIMKKIAKAVIMKNNINMLLLRTQYP